MKTQRDPTVPTGNYDGLQLVSLEHPYGWEYYKMGRYTVLVSPPEERQVIGGWHLSVCGHGRLPTWDEMMYARMRLLPADKAFMMPMPKMADYVNINEYVLHIYEAGTDWNMLQKGAA